MNTVNGKRSAPAGVVPCAMTEDRHAFGVDTTRPNAARRYNRWLEGKDTFDADRQSADHLQAVYPHIRIAAVENRRFLRRVVHHLAADRGIDQFLDLGVGIPVPPDVHDVAIDALAGRPDREGVRVVYVDHDPMVMAHARALLVAQPPSMCGYVEADIRDAERVLSDPGLRRVLDFGRPIGLLAVAVLHFLPDRDRPGLMLRRFVEEMPPGSFLAVSHATFDPLPSRTARRLAALGRPGSPHGPFQARTRSGVAAMLAGHSLVGPGLVPVAEWRPDGPNAAPAATFEQAAMYAAVAAL